MGLFGTNRVQGQTLPSTLEVLYALVLRNPVHQFIDLLQHEQPTLGVLLVRNLGVDAPRNLLDVVANLLSLYSQQ